VNGRCQARLALVVATAVLVVGCATSGSSTGPTSTPGSSSRPLTTATTVPVTTTGPFAPSTTVALSTTVPVTSTTLPPGWTEHGLLSQLIMVGASYADPGAAGPVVRGGAGGVVLVGQPAAGSAASITSRLAALVRTASIPAFVATDEEGGQIARLSNLVGPLPWPRQMAAQWSPAEVTGHLGTVGSAMRALGVTMDLAPVLDTASSSDPVDEESRRSFSESASTTTAYGLAFLRGLTSAGVIGVVKHFPGLGHANADTDRGPAADPPLAALAGDLEPFRQAIAAGVGVVMMSNVTEPDWGSAPAAVNPAAYAYLRHMGFAGVILTDSLDAGAITATGLNGARAVVAAIEAGADMAMITTPSDYPAALAGLEAAVASGALSMAQVITSVHRIVTVKNSILPPAAAITPP